MALEGMNDDTLPRQAMRAEYLDAETEAALARAWRDERDEQALHRLVTAYMRLAIATAARSKPSCWCHASWKTHSARNERARYFDRENRDDFTELSGDMR